MYKRRHLDSTFKELVCKLHAMETYKLGNFPCGRMHQSISAQNGRWPTSWVVSFSFLTMALQDLKAGGSGVNDSFYNEVEGILNGADVGKSMTDVLIARSERLCIGK